MSIVGQTKQQAASANMKNLGFSVLGPGHWNIKSDHPRDHPGRYLYYAGTFWLYASSKPLQIAIAQRDFGVRFMCV
jgi:hypothetical protein